MRGAGSEPRRARPHPMEKGGSHMLPVMVYYLAVNAAAFALGAAWSRRSVRALSALARLMVIAGGTPGMLAARALRGRGLRETGPLALAHPLIWLALHIAVLAALMDRAGGGTGGWLAVLGRAPGLGLYLACTNAAAFFAFAADKAKAALGRFRIREAALLALALAGGAPGALAAMDLCRHKIRTPRFAWGVPALLAAQCALLAWVSAMGWA